MKTKKLKIFRKDRKAFALVLSLALMGFMVLLIVTLSTLVEMQMRLSKQTTNQFKARQAAKFAAHQAMARVQGTLGPDQRITANAMMFDPVIHQGIEMLESDQNYDWWSTPMDIDRYATEEIDNQNLSQNRFWVGVWDSRRGYSPNKQKMEDSRDDYVEDTMERAITWLVSGNQMLESKPITESLDEKLTYMPTDSLLGKNYTRIVSSGSKLDYNGEQNLETDVLVPLVTLDKDFDTQYDGKQTNIGWWVSDEGQKASANAIATAEQVQHSERFDYRKQSMPYYSGIHGLTVPEFESTKAFNLDFEESGEATSPMNLARNLNDIKQLDIIKSGDIPESTQLSKIFFNALSFNTKGLLVNVRDGGLKKDLSIGLMRQDAGNEDEQIEEDKNENTTEFFERPYGVAGYEYKTTAYPLMSDNAAEGALDPTDVGEDNRILSGMGHIFGPQMYGNEDLESNYQTLSTIDMMSELFSDDKLWKDPGGPLWDQLRSYYNLRADNQAEYGKLESRVQTDDRFGFKPVIKRFQVFYVPTFVNYGSGQYGLRINIIPLLILYNPFDTKIAGDTYYAFALRGRYSAELGKFNVAIGYEDGNYFQCIRDLRTELIASFSDSVFKSGGGITSTTERNKTWMPLTRRVFWQSWQVWGIGTQSENTGWQWMASRYTPFYDLGGSGISAVPMGYGEPCNVNELSPVSGNVYGGIINQSNLYPSFETAKKRMGSYSVSVDDDGNIGYDLDTASYFSARIAKMPLFLNCVPVLAGHGSIKNITDNQTLVGGQFLNAQDTWGQSKRSTSNFAFIAYDKTGIEAGKAKIFAMQEMVNYQSGYQIDGPNGVVNDYEKYNAMLHGIDDGGQIGNGFFVNVAHPEREHEAKYEGQSYADSAYILFSTSLFSTYKSYLDSNHPTSIDNLYVDLQDQRAGSDDDEWDKPIGSIQATTPVGYGRQTMIMDYTYSWTDGTDASVVNYYSSKPSSEDEYTRVHLDAWIWKKEGFEFDNFRQEDDGTSGTWESWNKGLFTLMGPQMTYIKGSRFVTFKTGSFPQPNILYTWNSDIYMDQSGYSNYNFHVPGFVETSNGKVGLKAYNSFDNGTTDNELENYGFEIDSPDTERAFFEDREGYEMNTNADAYDHETSYITLARYYINWLALNPRRHSANRWLNYDSVDSKGGLTSATSTMKSNAFDSFSDIDSHGDIAPQSIKPIQVSSSTSTSYGSTLHSQINDTQGYIPYGFIFTQPYASNEDGNEPYFNRRLFVNTNPLATAIDYDGCGRDVEVSSTSSATWAYNLIGRLPKMYQSFSQAYGTFDAMTEVGYKVLTPDGSYVRTGLKPGIGATSTVINHILRKEEVVTNVANLAGANLGFGVGNYASSNNTANASDTSADLNGIFPRSYSVGTLDANYPALAIGSSIAPARISPERAYQVMWIDGAATIYELSTWQMDRDVANGTRDVETFYGDRKVHYDIAWLLNDALWDEYFFSTLPYRSDDKEMLISEDYAYPQNPRLEYAVDSDDDKLGLQDLTYPNNEDQFEENASKFWVNGAFNVNSTSVDAWKTILYTYYGQTVKDYSGSERENTDSTPMLRWEAPLTAEPYTSDMYIDDNDGRAAFEGYRSLSDAEIEELACSIVEHVKDRGPFYSMSHFVNRVIADMSAEERYTDYIGDQLIELPEQYSDRENLENEYDDQLTHRIDHGQKGILQAAIDATSINAGFHDDDQTIISIDNNRNMSEAFQTDTNYEVYQNPKNIWENWRSAIGPQATGAPTYLMQQDLLSRLGSFLTVRSDTFKIRAYGEIKNPVSGVVEAKAWCEMVVQRTPDFIDQDTQEQEAWKVYGREAEIGNQGDLKAESIDFNEHLDELSDLNKQLGRRFKIVSFRWLNSDEI